MEEIAIYFGVDLDLQRKTKQKAPQAKRPPERVCERWGVGGGKKQRLTEWERIT